MFVYILSIFYPSRGCGFKRFVSLCVSQGEDYHVQISCTSTLKGSIAGAGSYFPAHDIVQDDKDSMFVTLKEFERRYGSARMWNRAVKYVADVCGVVVKTYVGWIRSDRFFTMSMSMSMSQDRGG